MATDRDQTVWFPKDSFLGILLSIPLWGIAGLIWGFLMALTMGGSVIGWLFMGLLWGGTVWFFFSISMAILYREISTVIPLQEVETLHERLASAVKSSRYTVERQSATRFVCKPKRGLLALEYTKVHVQILNGSIHLNGPAVIVNKVRKKLLADASMTVSRSGST